jgi:hypothetical protein
MSNNNQAIRFDITNMTLIAFAGIIIKIFLGGSFSVDGTSGPAGAAMWGYGLVAIAVLIIMFVMFGISQNMNKIQRLSALEYVKGLFIHGLPPMLLLCILIWLIFLNARYFKRINQDNVASEYYNYSSVSTVLVIIQLLVLLKYFRENYEIAIAKGDDNAVKAALTSKLASASYLITLGNFMLAAIQNIILEFFSTDG